MPPTAVQLPKSRYQPGERPVDLVHLARQTLNDRAVEREVLGLFLRQSAIQMARLAGATTVAERRNAAHTMAGAARAIGAWPVARLAHQVESDDSDAGSGVLANLTAAVDQAADFIRSLLGEPDR